MSEENVEQVRRAAQAFEKQDALGDWSWFFEKFAYDDIELYPARVNLDAAESYRGREGWAEFWREFSKAWDEFRYDPSSYEFFDAGDQVLAFSVAVGKGRGSGIETVQEQAFLWTIRDGRLARLVVYDDRDEAREAAGVAEQRPRA